MDTTAPFPAPRRERLARTLLVTVAVKSLVLYGLWSACFSHPQTRHMLLPAAEVERHLFAAPAAEVERHLFAAPAAPDSPNKNQESTCHRSTTS